MPGAPVTPLVLLKSIQLVPYAVGIKMTAAFHFQPKPHQAFHLVEEVSYLF